MQFKTKQQQELKEELLRFELPESVIDKIIIHSDDNWVEQLINKLKNAKNSQEALAYTLELFMLKSFVSTPMYIAKKDIPKRFPISMRKLEDAIRMRLIPFIEVTQKSRVFNVDDIYKYLEQYKVDSIVNRVDPVSLQNAIKTLTR